MNVWDNASLEVQGKTSVESTSGQLTEGIRLQPGSSVSLQSLAVIATGNGNTTGVYLIAPGTTLTVNGLLTVNGNKDVHVGVDLNTLLSSAIKPQANLSGMEVKGGLGVLARDGSTTFSGNVSVSGGTGAQITHLGSVTLNENLIVDGGNTIVTEASDGTPVAGGIGLKVAGAVTVNGTTTVTGGGIGVYTTSGNSSVVSLLGSFDVSDPNAIGVWVDGGTGIRMKGNGSVTINNDLTIENGGTGAVLMGGTLTAGTVTVGANSYGVITSGGTTNLSAMTVDGGTGVSMTAGTVTIGNLSITNNGAMFDLGALTANNTITVTGTASFIDTIVNVDATSATVGTYTLFTYGSSGSSTSDITVLASGLASGLTGSWELSGGALVYTISAKAYGGTSIPTMSTGGYLLLVIMLIAAGWYFRRRVVALPEK